MVKRDEARVEPEYISDGNVQNLQRRREDKGKSSTVGCLVWFSSYKQGRRPCRASFLSAACTAPWPILHSRSFTVKACTHCAFLLARICWLLLPMLLQSRSWAINKKYQRRYRLRWKAGCCSCTITNDKGTPGIFGVAIVNLSAYSAKNKAKLHADFSC